MSNEILDAVRELLPTIAERTGSAEEKRVIPRETMTELADAGVLRMLQPRRYGGFECDPVEFYEVVRTLSTACGSTGWVVAVLGVHPWQLSLFDDAAQQEVWGSDKDTLLCSSYAPVGRLTPVEGGYRLSGHWSFSSGCDHASWALLGGLRMTDTGEPADFLTVVLPSEDYRIVDVWDSVGLAGTGSNDIVVDDAFVPDHRVMRNYDQARLRGPGQRVNTGPLYRMPFGAVFTSTVAAPVIGMVAGCLDEYLTAMRDRVRLSLGGGRFAADQFAQVTVGRAASEIDAARLQTDRNISELYSYTVAGEEIPMELRLRTRRDQARATERAVEAIDLLFKTAGGNSLQHGNTIERVWRDAHAGSVHVANDPDRALAMYGRGTFGLAVEDNLL